MAAELVVEGLQAELQSLGLRKVRDDVLDGQHHAGTVQHIDVDGLGLLLEDQHLGALLDSFDCIVQEELDRTFLEGELVLVELGTEIPGRQVLELDSGFGLELIPEEPARSDEFLLALPEHLPGEGLQRTVDLESNRVPFLQHD